VTIPFVEYRSVWSLGDASDIVRSEVVADAWQIRNLHDHCEIASSQLLLDINRAILRHRKPIDYGNI
jgi:hypothetical protein